MKASNRAGAAPGDSNGTGDNHTRPAQPEPTDTPAEPRRRPASGTGSTVRVAFSNPDEFLSELRDRGPNVDGVLRLTYRWHADASGAPVTDLWVVANYLRRLDPGALAVVCLEHHAGGVWWSGLNDAASEEARHHAEDIHQRIDAAARVLGYEVRVGAHRASPPPLEGPR